VYRELWYQFFCIFYYELLIELFMVIYGDQLTSEGEPFDCVCVTVSMQFY
jgi:hypothetical protein